jgi:hypothetical protein
MRGGTGAVAHRRSDGVPIVAVDGRVGEVSNLVLHNTGALGARRDTRRKTSSRGTLAHRGRVTVTGTTTAQQRSGIGEAASTAQGAALRYGGALGPAQGGWEEVK